MNSDIETIFTGFTTPVFFMRYTGTAKTYITYQEIEALDYFDAEDDMQYVRHIYDFDIFSKGDFTDLIASVKSLMKQNGWEWLPDNSSSDMYEVDTGYYHKTLSFAKNEYIGG